MDEPRKRGRPKKSASLMRKNPKWVPKKWRPEYSQMVMLRITGKSNIEIAEILRFTPQQVSNVLCLPEAERLLHEWSSKLYAETLNQMEHDLRETTLSAVDNVKKVMLNKDLLERAPMAMFDRSLALMKSRNIVGSPEAGGVKVQTNIVIGSDLQKLLQEGMAKAEEAKKLHSGS